MNLLVAGRVSIHATRPMWRKLLANILYRERYSTPLQAPFCIDATPLLVTEILGIVQIINTALNLRQQLHGPLSYELWVIRSRQIPPHP